MVLPLSFRSGELLRHVYKLPDALTGVLLGLLLASFGLSVVGCATPRERVDTYERVDPRLLEQTDEPAPLPLIETARAYHQAGRFCSRYPVFQRAKLLVHGGYSARFGLRPNSTAGVIYYFDSAGVCLRTDRTPCDGY